HSFYSAAALFLFFVLLFTNSNIPVNTAAVVIIPAIELCVSPVIRKPALADKPIITAYGSCVRISSLSSAADPVHDILLLSEIGEQWSPTMTQLIAVAMTSGSSKSSAIPIGIAIGIIIEKTPHELPEAKAIRPPRRKIITGTKKAGR